MTLNDSDILAASILIVDDQQDNVWTLEQMLAAAGYPRVASTTNPRQVCALHRQHQYDLILLDLQMPGMDGFEVMEQLKLMEPSGYLPVLVLTGQTAHKLRALQAGAKDFVSKPFDTLEIQTRIRNMLEVRLLYKKVESNNRQLELTVLERTAELRESEARFRSLVELASDWYWEQDENGAFTKVSGPALEMLGLGEKQGDENHKPPRWNEAQRALLDESLAARRPFIDFVYSRVNADGSEQFLQTSGEPKFDESGRFTGYRGIGMDVTGRMKGAGVQRPEQDLLRLRKAMDALDDVVLVLDRSTMRFVDVNAAASRVFGYAREELLASGPSLLSGRSDAEHERDFDRLIASEVHNANGESHLLRKDGSSVLAHVQRQASQIESEWVLVEVIREVGEAG
ncbi:MAG: response regulator [Arenimonas sp.]